MSELLGLLLGFGALALWLYRPVFPGGFVSDDLLYYVLNPATASAAPDALLALLDPRSPAHHYSYNYAPLHLALVALGRRLFGASWAAHHALNVLAHATNAVLLVALLRASRAPRVASWLGGAVFLLHPAQVEAVAWISQLKSVASLSFGLAAVLCLERLPRLALLLFTAALLTKFGALAFLPMSAALLWARRAPRDQWIWLAAWLAPLALVATAQWIVFGYGGGHDLEVFDGLFVQLRTVAAIGARYLWMAATGLGLSAFHDPEPARSLLDPWWLLGLAAGAALLWRLGATLKHRREEAAWWLLALASFVPVSQLVPFRFPVADRYLYFMLPGLIGGVWLAGAALGRRLREAESPEPARASRAFAYVAVAAMLPVFALQASARVPLWLEERQLVADSARHYPMGSHGFYLRAVEAAAQGDVQEAVAELRSLEERWRLSLVRDFEHDPRFAYIRDEPAFRAFVRDTARFRIEWALARGLRPGEQAVLAQKYMTLGDFETAIELIESLLREGDPRTPQLLQLLDQAKRGRAQQRPRDR